MLKIAHSLKDTMLSCHLFQIFHEKPPAAMSISGQKKSQFCQNYTILWAKKVNKMPFFFFPISRKIRCSHVYILSKYVHSLKTHCTHAYILPIKRPFAQKYNSLMSFLSKFWWKTPCCHALIWSKKRQFCQNYTILCIMGQKSR